MNFCIFKSLFIFLQMFFSVINSQESRTTPGLCVFAPADCSKSIVKFLLYKNDSNNFNVSNNSQRENPTLLNLQELEKDFRDGNRLPLVILLHGYGHNGDLTPNQEIRSVLLHHEKVNVVTVDYSTYVQRPCYYPWAVVNTRHVAKCLAQFMDTLIALNYYDRQQFHLIGFSLGAQIAGLVANFAHHKVYRITGLDPARPGFTIPDRSHKLDATDADFVDIIHTDPLIYSHLQPLGDADFYPNLENFHQKGCSHIVYPRLCNHYRAAAYYAESIYTEVGFWSYNCGNWTEFLANRCHSYSEIPMVPMGYHLPMNAKGSYFLSTADRSPYALGYLPSFELDVINSN